MIGASREVKIKDNKISRSGVWGWGHMTDHMTMVLHKSYDHDITSGSSEEERYNVLAALLALFCWKSKRK